MCMSGKTHKQTHDFIAETAQSTIISPMKVHTEDN